MSGTDDKSSTTTTSNTTSGTSTTTPSPPQFEQSIVDTTGTTSRLVINVPNWDGGRAVSYLRLGSVPLNVATTPEPGDTLAKMVQTTVDSSGNYTANAFIDDTRDRDGTGGTSDNSGQNATTNTVASRQAESLKLHTKGGWRDHSDGNRITTTQGDKVEVIRGNYKLLVLGRQDNSGNGDALDISGGHTIDGNAAPGSISEIKWVQDTWSGTWKVTEETEKGDTKTVFHGNVEEIFYGNSVTSTVGSEHPDQTITCLLSDPTSTQYKLNPTITENTWANTITSNTGSSETWVNSISETTYVTTETSEKHCVTTTETLDAGSSFERKAVGFMAEATVCGLKIEGYLGPVIETYAGLKLEFELAAKVAISIAAQVEINIGPKLEIRQGTDFKISATGTVEVNESHTDLTAIKTRIVGTNTTVGNASTTVSTTQTNVNTSTTTVTTAPTTVSAGPATTVAPAVIIP